MKGIKAELVDQGVDCKEEEEKEGVIEVTEEKHTEPRRRQRKTVEATDNVSL